MLPLAGLFFIAFGSGRTQSKVEREAPVHPEFYRPPSKGPTLVMVTSEIRIDHVSTTTPTLVLPVIPDYTGQKLVSLEVACDQPEAKFKWKVREDEATHSREVLVSFAKARDGVAVQCKMFAIAPGETVTRTQNKDFDRWLGKTAIDPELKSYGQELKTPSDIVKWVAARDDSQLPKGVGRMDEYGRALVCTALLRRQKIAARPAEVVLTWPTRRQSLAWMTEYVDDDGVWEMADPTVGIAEAARNSYFVISTPALSTVGEAPTQVRLSEQALGVFPAPGGGRLLVAAAHREVEVLESAKKGQSLFFQEAEITAAAKKGVSNLSLYLLGRPSLPDSPKHSS